MATFFSANLMLRREVLQRQKLPMGDADDPTPLLPVAGGSSLPPFLLAGTRA